MIADTPHGSTDSLDPFGKGDTYTENVVIFVYGTLHDLEERGLIDGGSFELSDGGLTAYRTLKASGFEPTNHEVDWAMAVIQRAYVEGVRTWKV